MTNVNAVSLICYSTIFLERIECICIYYFYFHDCLMGIQNNATYISHSNFDRFLSVNFGPICIVF